MGHGKAYVIGAGLAGLSAAVALAERGIAAEIFEAAPYAGGRCRSYFEPSFDSVIDNGNHLVLSGNHAVHRFLSTIGSLNHLAGPDRAEFNFADVRSGTRWQINPNDGPVPWWTFNAERRVPDTKARDYLALVALLRAGPGQRVSDVVPCKGMLWERLISPFLVAALNTEPQIASASLARAVIAETLAKGGRTYRPRIASPTLAATFIEPALAYLSAHDANLHLGTRLRGLSLDDARANALDLGEERIMLEPRDAVILAVPPWIATTLLPDLTVPDEFRAIVNGHFKIAPPKDAPLITGVIGGTVEWIFAFEDRISITVSCADRIVDEDREALARLFWREVQSALGIEANLPVWRIVKERRATLAATPEQNAKRPRAATQFSNLFLAGDWTQTGLPATIEGALRSGATAAELALARFSL